VVTDIFIIAVFSIVVIYDIIALIIYIKRKMSGNVVTVSAVKARWYDKLPFIPYAVGVVFLGHFENKISLDISLGLSIAIMSIISVIFLLLTIFWRLGKLKAGYKIYQIMCDWSIIPALIGYVVGGLFWPVGK
jgi:hypothetical protein